MTFLQQNLHVQHQYGISDRTASPQQQMRSQLTTDKIQGFVFAPGE